MSAFKKFGFGDQIDNVLVLQPKYDLASGSLGWRGSPDGSASLFLYGGIRRSPSHVFSDIRYQPLYPGINQFGQPTRGQPLTASLNVVWVTDEPLSLGQITANRWGEEHWSTLQRLYQDYHARDPDFVTGTYDFYSAYFQKDSGNCIVFQGPRSGSNDFPSGSWAIESWVKPLCTSSLTNDFTIASMNQTFWLGMTGSTGRLVFSSSAGAFTASSGPTKDHWSHVAVTYDSVTQTGSFRINLVDAGSFGHIALVPPNSFTASFSIGQRWSGSVAGNIENADSTPAGGLPRRSFHGMIGETRFWFTGRSDAQLSSSMRIPLTGSSAASSYYSTRFNEGPLMSFGDNDLATVPLDGSGTLNQRAFASSSSLSQFFRVGFGYFRSFNDRVGPVWLPNDNIGVTVPKRLTTPDLSGVLLSFLSSQGSHGSTGGAPRSIGVLPLRRMLVIDIPSAFYGRQVVPGTLQIVCNAYSTGSFSLVRTVVDDGRGGLFISGTMASGSDESYRGVEWNKVGNVFYGEGLVVLKEPSLLDFGRDDGAPQRSTDTLQLSFRGDSRIPVKTLMCRIDRGEFNATNNQTFMNIEEDGTHIRRHASGSVYATAVGIYNSDRELVGIAKLADPLRIRDRDKLNIRIRMDF